MKGLLSAALLLACSAAPAQDFLARGEAEELLRIREQLTSAPSPNQLLAAECPAPDRLPADFPAELRGSETDAPVPSWEQVRDGGSGRLPQLLRLLGGDEAAARARFDGWNGAQKRTFGLYIDKGMAKGWLDALGPLLGEPGDGWMLFHRDGAPQDPASWFHARSRGWSATFTENGLWGGGVAGAVTAWNHKDWTLAWMENDVPHGALHVGLLPGGAVETHLEVYNPLFTNGAPLLEVSHAPWPIGSFNARLTVLHKRWEDLSCGAYSRRSYNHYRLIRASHRSPLTF
jgi:hypothetical protein